MHLPKADDSAIAARVIALREEGAGIAKIQSACGIGADRVQRILDEAGDRAAAGDGDGHTSAIAEGTRALIAAIRRHHPERCGLLAEARA